MQIEANVTFASLKVVLTVSKPGEKGDVPVGVIAGSVIAGLVLLALVVGLLWKVETLTYSHLNSLSVPSKPLIVSYTYIQSNITKNHLNGVNAFL